MIPDYQYRVHDYSIITPIFKKYLVAPLFRLVPLGIPANIITIISNSFMYVALFLALAEYPGRSLRFVLIAILVLAYAIGDHFDGMQAKRTGTSSALGELCDHYLDIFNNGILLFTVCLLFEITQPLLIAFFLSTAYLTHAAIFYEQFSTKYLYFEQIGSLESLLILVFCILVSTIEPVYRFVMQTLLCGLSIAEIAFIVSTSGAFLTIAKIIRRAHIVDIRFYLFAIFQIAIAYLAMTFMSPIALFCVITLYSGLYIGNLQRGHLADGKNRFPDFVVPTMIVLAYAFEPLRHPYLLWALGTYLAIGTLWISVNSFWILRRFWVWKNPTTELR